MGCDLVKSEEHGSFHHRKKRRRKDATYESKTRGKFITE